MRTIDRRLANLEHRYGIARTQTTYVVVLMDAGSKLGAAQETYIAALRETGSREAGAFSVVDLTKIPIGTQCPMEPVITVVLDKA